MTHAQAPEGGWTIETVAAELLRCEDEQIERPPFTDDWADLDLDTGYAIQDLNLRARLASQRSAAKASAISTASQSPSSRAGRG